MDDVFSSIVQNAISFLKSSLEELEHSPSRSVISFATAVELICKARLVREHWTLIVKKPDECSEAKFKAGECLTIDPKSISKRLQAVVGYRFTQTEERVFQRMRNHRNKLIHFYDETFSKPPDDATRVEVASELCAGWYYLYRLVTKRWKEVFKDFAKEFDGLERLMAKERGFLKAKYDELKPQINADMVNGVVYLDCPICGFEAERRSDELPPLFRGKCIVCSSKRRYLSEPCPSCSAEIIVDDMGEGFCHNPTCYYHFQLEYLLEKHTPYASKDELLSDGPKIAVCHECSFPEPTVIPWNDSWLCLCCLEVHNQPEYCNKCGELSTGDLSESFVLGCESCRWLLSSKNMKTF